MAMVLVVSAILSTFTPTRTWAANFTGKNIWAGGSEAMFGKSRNYLYRWTDGYQMTFCIDPGDHMGSEVRAGAVRYNIDDDNIPYITGRADFERLALICDWFDTQAGSISASNASYAAAQAAVWAVVTGAWDNVEAIVSQVNRHVSGTSARWQELKAYMNTSGGTGSGKLPGWCSVAESSVPTNMMTLTDGKYKIDLDLAGCPELASVPWEFPDANWSKSVSGNTLTLTYSGTDVPQVVIKGSAPPSMNSIVKNSQNLTIYIPEREKDQAMVGAGLKPAGNMIYMRLTGTQVPSAEGTSSFDIYQHSETFESHYNVDLTKFDSETGQTLEGSIFEVLEAFDSSQLNLVDSNGMSPRPSTWSGFRSDGQIMTDADGYASHQDVRYYDYSKTYCNGHPDPDFLDVPTPEPDQDTGEIINADEIAAAESENERLKAEWEATVALCESDTDFHSVTEGEGLAMMLQDRDATYEEFIHLEYDYTLREIEARYGYILHGRHNDDERIPVVRINSSEAGASSVAVTRNVLETGEGTPYNTFRKMAAEKGVIQTLLPATAPYSLDGSRLITVEEILEDEVPEEEVEEQAADGMAPHSDSGDEENDFTEEESRKTTEPDTSSTEADGSEDGFDTADKAKKERVLLKETAQEESLEATITEESAETTTEESTETTTESSTETSTGESPDPPTEPSTEAVAKESTEERKSKHAYRYSLFHRSYGTVPPPQLINPWSDGAAPSMFSLDSAPVPPASRAGAGLPFPQEDDVEWIVPWGDTESVAYGFRISNRRTEGEIHINKRDLELYNQDPEGSYGQTQGDATLEGAVYGLFAAQDIVHPDGKTGTVYQAGELTALATTDENGDASFMAYTEESQQSETAGNLDGRWVGHPLILGNYYVREMSRSEGYELSVSGIHLAESNREGSEIFADAAGTAHSGTLGHPIDMHDGSWNEFTVTARGTEKGYDVQITGYPEGARVYRSRLVETTTTETVVIGSVRKETGEFEKAAAGERKLDPEGNYIPVLDADGNPERDESSPMAETFFTYYRLNAYPSGTATPKDQGKWTSGGKADAAYVREEANSMLKQIGFKALDAGDGDGAPWSTIDLEGATNRELVEGILDWFAENNFWDSGSVHRVYEDGGIYRAEIFHDYKAVIAPAIYDPMNGVVYLRKEVEVDGGAGNSHMFVPYPEGEFTISGSYATVSPAKAVTGAIPFLADMADFLEIRWQPLYETYQEGDYRLDGNGQRIPVYETEFVYGEEEQTTVDYQLTPVTASYDGDKGVYAFHVDNEADWGTTDVIADTYRIVTRETSVIVDGEEMYYSDYLTQVKGAGASAFPTVDRADTTYVRHVNLAYPGQMRHYQDGGTRTSPTQVLERAIKQSIKVTKDVSQESYDTDNTYRMHRDPFTVLFGGYQGKGRKYVPGFHFKAYLVSDLEEAAVLPEKADGTYDFDEFFRDEKNRDLWNDLAVSWDRPEKDVDGDPTTLHANEGGGAEAYYGRSVMLPYGVYVVVEQVPTDLLNKHYEIDAPRVVAIPFVPEITAGGTVSDQPSSEYLYFSDYTPEELTERFGIRFHEETDVIQAHNHDGDFEIYKYGLDKDAKPDAYGNAAVGQRYKWESTSEDAGTADGVYYQILYDRDGNALDYGVTLYGVDTMTGMTRAINGKYAQALVPWSVLEERSGEEGNRHPGLEADGGFNFVSYLKTHFENALYSSKLRVEKIDGETGENIIHGGALFRIYATGRDVSGDGGDQVSGTGNVAFRTTGVTGTREELEARGDVDGIHWNGTTFEGTVTEPDYSRLELVTMLDETGKETGIFKAFSTEREVLKEDGTISREKVGYIETYQPLGAGTYVLVEIQAPPGYMKSKPVAFEVYRDKVTYYPDGSPGGRSEAQRYQYVVSKANQEAEITYQDVSQVIVKDKPSSLHIHKVEDGDETVGDENGLDGLAGVNDEGDLVTYEIRGRKEYLEARGDVNNITWDADNREYAGTVSKSFQEWSENLIAGTEEEILAMENGKSLYDRETGDYSGFGIRFDRTVAGAELTLYKGLEVSKVMDHVYRGVTVRWSQDEVIGITASETGSRLEITTKEREATPPYHRIWDAEAMENQPVNLFFYDLDAVDTEEDEASGELWVLDEGGNRLCLADSISGMAYAYDDYGRMIAYEADENGGKKVAQSIEIHQEGGKEHIYINVDTTDDQLGFPLYYNGGEVTYQDEAWTSDGTPHKIARLPFGAYVLEETRVPHDQGYVQSPHMGLILRESGENQHIFMQNDFTKVDIAKIDTATKGEIQDAGMTLYEAVYVRDDSPKGYRLEKGAVYAQWISGYQYDDDGALKLIRNDEKVATTGPHWIDHVPVGWYLLEETRVPREWGYVQSDPVEIHVRETGNVQTYVMEDDYTSIEVKKQDANTGEVLDQDHRAKLSLYKADLDGAGNPVIKTTRDVPGQEIPAWDPDARVVTWETGDGADVLASGRQVTDEYGVTNTVYDYDVKPVPVTPEIRQARYYVTETGATRFEYLPPGHYVLVEEESPEGYATAAPQLVTVREIGQKEEIQHHVMEDIPLVLEVSKACVAGGSKEVAGAHMAIYPVSDGERQPEAAYTWISGSDGRYTEADLETGEMPLGYQVGDLRPHRIEYIPAGDYVLVETTAPYGFLQAVDMPFSVADTGEVQGVQMVDEIPDGRLVIAKHDADQPDRLLAGAKFTLTNKDTGTLIETLTTDDGGKAEAAPVPIGYMDNDGKFQAYTYVVEEVSAPADYMLNTGTYEFQFPCGDGQTPLITVTYDAMNRQNQVRFKKQDDGGNHLAGARLKVVRKGGGQVIEEWVTQGQDHYITGIQAGDYTLIEVETPGSGYALAADIDFTVGVNMTEPVSVEMTDPSSRVDVGKVASGTATLLAGAKLQLLTEGGTLVREWTSDSRKPETFYGLAPGTYIIRELSAPSGYQRGGDMEITVVDTSDIQLFYFENDKKPEGGGGVTPVPKQVAFKKAGTDGRFLEGAQFTFYKADGSVYETKTTDASGIIRIPMPPAGTYTFRETRAPEGYYVSSQTYSFTVTEDRVVTGDYQVVDVPRTVVEIEKKSAETGETLPGALFQVLRNEAVIWEGLTDAEGKLRFPAPEPGTYQLREVKAPENYQASALLFEFTVHEDGTATGNTTIYNSKNQKIGRVTAWYQSALSGSGSASFGSRGNIVPVGKTGDDTPLMLYSMIWMISLAGVGFLAWRIKREKKQKFYGGLWLILTAVGLALTWGKPVYAEETRTERVNGTIVYQGVEQADRIPETAVIQVTDEAAGTVTPVTVPLKEYEYSDYRWTDDFEFFITVEEADAETYALGDQLIERQEENPFAGYEEQLLSLIGVSQDAYRIHQVSWISDSWQGEDGIVYRQAIARGSKRVADVTAVYEGLVEREAVAEEVSDHPPEVVLESRVELADVAAEEREEEGEEGALNPKTEVWDSIYWKVVTISLFLILIVVLVIGWMIRRRRRRDEED